MAIYHCSVKIIGRSSGRSSVAAAAYRAGENLVNEYDGVEHDYRKKHWVEYTKIVLPDNAPREYADRGTLWNAVETAEKSQDAQLAREFELALPVEMSRAQQIEIIHKFVNDKLISQGMIADIAIHNPPVTNDRHQPIDKDGHPTNDISQMTFINPHAHILATVRPMDESGRWQRKASIEYMCKKGVEEKAFTAEEFKAAKDDGWEKQYKYQDGKKKVWLTSSEGEARGLERLSRSPKTSKFGRKNEITENWNSKDRIFEWRQYWEKVVNDGFEKMNSKIRIDSRSFKKQGRTDEEPSLHMGTSATNMEKRANREIREGKSEAEVVRSDIGNINREIKAHNKFVRELKKRFAAIAEAAKDLIEKAARKLEAIRARLIGNNYEETEMRRKYNYFNSTLVPERNRLYEHKKSMSESETVINNSSKKIKSLQSELVACPQLKFSKKAELKKMINEEQRRLEDYSEYFSGISARYGFASIEEFDMAERAFAKRLAEYKKLGDALSSIEADNKALLGDYEKLSREIVTIEPIKEDVLDKKRGEVRIDSEGLVKDKLERKYGSDFNIETYADAVSKADNMLYKSGKARGYGDKLIPFRSVRARKRDCV